MKTLDACRITIKSQYGFSELDEIIEGLGGKAIKEMEIYEKPKMKYKSCDYVQACEKLSIGVDINDDTS